MCQELFGCIEHLCLLLGTTGREQNGMLRNALTHGKHTLEQSLIGVVAQAANLSGRTHIHTEHRVCFLQTVERELAGLDTNVVEVEEILIGLLHRLTEHHPGSQVDEVDLKHLAHKGEGAAGAEVTLDNHDVVFTGHELNVERTGDVQLLRNLTADTLDTSHRFDIELLRRQLQSGITRVDTGKLNVLTNGISHDFSLLSHAIEVYFLGMLNKLADDHGMILTHVGCQFQEALEFFAIGTHIHGRSGKHIARTDKNREADTVNKLINVVHRRQRAPLRLVDTIAGEHLRELRTILSIVNVFGCRTKDVDILSIEIHGQVVRNLATRGDDDAIRILHVDDIHDALKGQLIEIKAVTHIIVCGYCFRIIVDHNTAITALANGVQSLHTTPVELHRASDAVSTRTKNDHRTPVVGETDVAGHTIVGHIEIVGLSRILSCQGIDLLDNRQNVVALAQATHHEQSLVHIAKFPLQSYCTGNLEIGKTIDLCLTKQFTVERIDIATLQTLIDIDDVFQFIEKPLVNLCQVMDLIDSVTLMHGFRDNEDTLVGRFTKCLIDIIDFQLFILNIAMHALTDHAQAFLNSFLEVTANRHHLTDALHAGAQLTVNTTEL